MELAELLSKYGIVAYAATIFFGGKWGLKYFTYFRKTRYNFLVFASVAAICFVVLEKAAGTLRVADSWRYLLTFFVTTGCYDYVSDYFTFLKPKNKQTDETD